MRYLHWSLRALTSPGLFSEYTNTLRSKTISQADQASPLENWTAFNLKVVMSQVIIVCLKSLQLCSTYNVETWHLALLKTGIIISNDCIAQDRIHARTSTKCAFGIVFIIINIPDCMYIIWQMTVQNLYSYTFMYRIYIHMLQYCIYIQPWKEAQA